MRAAETHYHLCPVCHGQVGCDRRNHFVGHTPRAFVAGVRSTQRFKLCERCSGFESKEMKTPLGGDLVILAQLLERGPNGRNPIDVLAEALLMKGNSRPDLQRALRRAYAGEAREREASAKGGQSQADRREAAVTYYIACRSDGGKGATRATMKAFPGTFPNERALKQAVYRFRTRPRPQR